MQVDFSVELGADDPKLEFPWSSPDGQHRYFDLKADPQLISEIAEAAHNPALRSFLSAINSKASILQTAKCDTWTSRELAADEEIFGASVKYGCYIDLVPTSDAVRFSFEAQERLAQCLVKLLQRVPEIPASAEFMLRRCYYHAGEDVTSDSRAGFYSTFYLSGYGDDEGEAVQRWAIALKLVENALLQLSAAESSRGR